MVTLQAAERGTQTALWMPSRKHAVSFAEIIERSRRIQYGLRGHGVAVGDVVLVLDTVSPRLYCIVLALLASGASVMLVEPWMGIGQIEHAIRAAQPRFAVSGLTGRLLAMTVPAVRAINRWISPASLERSRSGPALEVASVDEAAPGILTFTSGTTGLPKGLVRSHGQLLHQHTALTRALGLSAFRGSDLCIFPNFVLSNLAAGRTSILVPPSWSRSHLQQIEALPEALQPETLTCGPGFLLRLMATARVPTLRSIHIGGALTDCDTLETGFSRWPDCDWTGVYGSAEAEPVATSDARRSVKLSRARGYFQVLHLGHPVEAVAHELCENGLWVSGPHVCAAYVGGGAENNRNKRVDDRGRLWHFMGDRVRIDDPAEGWWYAGRSTQAQADFDLEQAIYGVLRSSTSFIHRDTAGRAILVGENVTAPVTREVLRRIGVDGFREASICRDARHRARIDRKKTLRKDRLWPLW